MSAAHCVSFFFSLRTKNERASYRKEDRLLDVNYLHGLHGRQLSIEIIAYRLGLKPIDYCYTIKVAFLVTKLATPKKKTCELNINPLDIKNYQRSLRFGLGSTFSGESKHN